MTAYVRKYPFATLHRSVTKAESESGERPDYLVSRRLKPVVDNIINTNSDQARQNSSKYAASR